MSIQPELRVFIAGQGDLEEWERGGAEWRSLGRVLRAQKAGPPRPAAATSFHAEWAASSGTEPSVTKGELRSPHSSSEVLLRRPREVCVLLGHYLFPFVLKASKAAVPETLRLGAWERWRHRPHPRDHVSWINKALQRNPCSFDRDHLKTVLFTIIQIIML